jgi:hypothetical protein
MRIPWEPRNEPPGRGRCKPVRPHVLQRAVSAAGELTGASPPTRDAVGANQLTEPGAALRPALEFLDARARRWPGTPPDHSG